MTVQEKPQRVWMRIAVMVLCLAMGGARWLEAQTRPSRQPVRPKLSRLQRLRLEQQWFALGRRSPDKKAAAWHLLRARRQARRIPFLQRPSLQPNTSAATAESTGWSFQGPQPINTAGAQDDGNVSGIVSAIAVDLANDPTGNTIYIGTTYGGVWKSTNALSASPTFTPLSDSASSLDIGAVALGPDNAQGQPMLYAGTGKWIQDYYQGVGLLESGDGGATWSLISSADNGAEQFAGLSITSILVDPQNPQTVLMSTALTYDPALNGLSSGYNPPANNLSGIYRSTDGGQTWSLAFVPPGYTFADCSQIAYDASTKTYYAAFAGVGFYASTDQGANWTALAAPFANGAAITADNFFAVSMAAQNGKLYALIANDSGGLGNLSMPTPCADPSAANPGNCDTGLVESVNGGQSWISLPVPSNLNDGTNALFCEPGSNGNQCQGIYDQFLGLTPDGNTLVLGGIDVWSLNLATQTYTQVSQGYADFSGKVHTDQHAIAFAGGGDWFIGNDGGVWSTADAGGTGQASDWQDMNATLGVTTFYSATQVLDANNNPILAGGAQDDGTDFQTAGRLWQQQIWGDGGLTQAVPQNSQQYAYENDGGYLGATSTIWPILQLQDIVDSNTITEWQNYAPLIFPYQFEPSNPAQLIVGSDCRLWRGPYAITTATTGNPDPNWQAISGDLTNPGGVSDCSQMQGLLTSFAEAPNSADTIYAGTSTGLVWVSTNATCSEGSAPSCQMPAWTEIDQGLLPQDPVSAIAVEAANAQTAVIGIMGFGHGHVFLTSDAGATWSDISGNLPDAPVNAVVIDPNHPQNIYVGNDVGVFVATDGGAGGGNEQWLQLGPDLPNVPIIQLQFSQDQQTLIAASFGRGAWTIPVLGGSGSSSTPDFTLSATPSTQSVAAGVDAVFTIATTAVNADTSAITLSCTVPASGCSFSPAVVAPGAGSTLTVSASALVSGANTIIISGTDGTNTHSTSVEVDVTTGTAQGSVIENVLYNFTGNAATPMAGLIADSAGNLYGTTFYGGNSSNCLEIGVGCGTVFEFVKSSGSFKILYSFNGFPNDGFNPTAPLVMDAAGNLYGTTTYGGSPSCACGAGDVYELVNNAGNYTEKVLYGFSGYGDGGFPQSGLVLDKAGNLYGTTFLGGANGLGAVYELVNSSGNYTEKILYSFTSTGADGAYPAGSLILDAAGNIYGTTTAGGSTGNGTVFALMNNAGSYSERVLYSFAGYPDASGPTGGLILDNSGNLFGATNDGGANGSGAIFELIDASGNYTENVLYSFGGANDPYLQFMPQAPLVMDSNGNLFSVEQGGPYDAGAVFELSKTMAGYIEQDLYNFTGGADGNGPNGGLVLDSVGNLYGTTQGGGSNDDGTIFELNMGSGPAVTLSKLSLSFNNVPAGATSSPQNVTVTNTGNANLLFGTAAVTITGANAGDFALSGDSCSGAALAPDATCAVSITFTPSLASSETAALNFNDNAANSPQTVNLAGNGGGSAGIPDFTLSAAPSTQSVAAGVDAVFTIATTAVNADTSAIMLNCTAPASGCSFSPAAVAPGAVSTLTVSASALVSGANTIIISGTDGTNTHSTSVEVDVSGTPAVTVSPASLNFGNQAANTVSAPQTVTITNNGTADLMISEVQNTPEFSYTSNENGSCNVGYSDLAPGASCQIQVTFAPDGVGAFNGTLSIYDNAAGSPQTVQLSGTAPAGIGTWSQLNISGSQPGMNDMGINNVFAGPGDTLILYGAWTDDVWVLSHADGQGGASTWTEFNPGGNVPSHRAFPSLAYDPAGNNLIMFGGETCLSDCNTQTPIMGNTNDVWVLSNANGNGGAPAWIQLQPSGTPPPPRDNSVAEYDAANNRLILFGGDNFFNQVFSDTWVLTNANGMGGTPAWIQLNPSGQAPQNIDNPGAFYDAVNNQLVVIGGGNNFIYSPNANVFNAVWRLTNANGLGGGAAWSQTLANNSPGAPNVSIVNYWDGISKSGTVYDGAQTVWSAIDGQLWQLSDANGATPSWSVSPHIGLPTSYAEVPRIIYNSASGIITNLFFDYTYSAGSQQLNTMAYTLSPNSPPSPTVILTPSDYLYMGDEEWNQIIQTASAPQTVTVANETASPITISQFSINNFIPSNNDFTIYSSGTTCTEGGTLVANGGSCAIAVQFTPTIIGGEGATLNIIDNTASHSIGIFGNGTALQLSNNALAFGSQIINTTSTAQSITVTNKTSNPDPISLSIGTNLPFKNSYTENDNCGASLAAGASCTVSVTFRPSQTGTIYGYVVISEDQGNAGVYAGFRGTGITAIPQVALSPNSLSFGNQPVNTASAAQTVTLANTGSATLNLASISASGDFTETNNCASTLAANANCAIAVTFTPAQAGTRSGTLSITDDAANSPQTVPLSGTGIAPAVTLAPASLANFGSVLVGQTSAAETVTLTNSGTAALAITSIAASGDFAATNTCGTSVAAGANCAIAVTFTPTQTGARTGTLTISDNAANSPQTVPLSGTGTAPAVTLAPAALADFGNVLVGQTSAAETVTLTNSGSAALAITSIAASGDFAATNTCGTSVAAGANCAIAVTFTPTQTGARTGTLTISDNAANSPQTMPLSGTGLALPAGVLSPASLIFGSQATGSTSAAQTVILSNPGGAALSISSIVTSGDFAQTNSCGSSLAAGGSCPIAVTFTPTASGARTGSLSVSDNAGGSPQTVTLSGNGIASGITFTPDAITFGSTGLNSTATQGLTITNSGSADLHISNMSASGDFTVSGNCVTVPAGSSCSINVNFTPSAAGTRTGTITLTDDAPDSPQTIPVSGIGVAPGVLVSPSSLEFPDTAVNSGSYPITATLANAGTVELTGISISASGDYAETNNCPASLAPAASAGALGQSCQIEVVFKPSLAGADAGTLTISDNAGEQTLALAGDGVAPGAVLSASQLNFGGQSLGTTSLAQTVVLTNTGSSALSLNSITVTSGFNLTTSCVDNTGTGSLAAGSSCPINISFTPVAAGAQTGKLTISDSAANSPQTVALTGTGNSTGLAITPSALTFGSEVVNSTSDSQTLTLTNTGTTALTLAPVSITGDFQQVNTCPANAGGLAAGASCSVNVSFTPTVAGERTGSLTVSDSSGTVSAAAVLAGTGSQPGISTAPATLFFGGTVVGSSSAGQTITVTNTGTSPLIISAVLTSGDFSATNTCVSASLAAGQDCVISVAMHPTTTGNETGAVEIYDNADGLHSIAVSGVGVVDASLLPAELSFGSQPIPGANSSGISLSGATQNVVLTNLGQTALSLTGLAIQSPFSQTNDCGTSLAAGASCTLAISFAPQMEGQATGSLSFTGASGITESVALNGYGSPNGLTLSPSTLNFGTQTIGQASPTQTATLTNNTGQAISNLIITASGEYSQTNNCNGALANGASCAIQVSLQPATSGTVTGAISISGTLSGSASSRQWRGLKPLASSGSGSFSLAEVALSGSGSTSGVSLSATSVSFSDQTVGTSSKTQTVTLTNSGQASLTGVNIGITGDFSQTNSCGTSVAAGKQCAITVLFSPTATGTRTGTLSIADSAAGSPQTIALAGVGLAAVPQVALSKPSLTFAGQTVGTSSGTQTITLGNTGAAALDLTAIGISGDFAQTNNCGTSVAAGANCSIQVTFNPAAGGTRNGALTFTDNASGSPQSVTLTGTGEDFSLAVASGGSSSATVSAGGTATYSLSLTPKGGYNQAVSLACTGAPNLATCSVSPASVTLNGTNASSLSVTVTTTAAGFVPAAPKLPGPPSFAPAWLLLAGLGFILFGCGYREKLRLARLLPCAGLLLLLSYAVACGGNPAPAPPPSPGTPAGSYTLTVTGTSGGLSHTQNLTLKVN